MKHRLPAAIARAAVEIAMTRTQRGVHSGLHHRKTGGTSTYRAVKKRASLEQTFLPCQKRTGCLRSRMNDHFDRLLFALGQPCHDGRSFFERADTGDEAAQGILIF